jgi:hypothetical protein
MSLESDGGMILTGETRRTRRKTCPNAALSTTNPTWIDPGANPGLRGERPATDDLSHGTARGRAGVKFNGNAYYSTLYKEVVVWTRRALHVDTRSRVPWDAELHVSATPRRKAEEQLRGRMTGKCHPLLVWQCYLARSYPRQGRIERSSRCSVAFRPGTSSSVPFATLL